MTTPARRPLLGWSPGAVVFDCDGTLMDSERHWQEARHRAFRDFGLQAPPGFAEQAKGVHYAHCGRLMAEAVRKPGLAADLTASLLDHFLRLVTDDPVTMPGAADLVRLLSGRVPLAVASNCPREVVEGSLDRAGLLEHFQHVVVPSDAPPEGGDAPRGTDDPGRAAGPDPACVRGEPEAGVRGGAGAHAPGAAGARDGVDVSRVVRPKPWPDVYATAARLCGVRPGRALAVEDSLTGVESALRAGLRVLGVGPRPDGADRADLWLPTLRAPELLSWARTLAPGPEPGSGRG